MSIYKCVFYTISIYTNKSEIENIDIVIMLGNINLNNISLLDYID